jgi:hypothetical protein
MVLCTGIAAGNPRGVFSGRGQPVGAQGIAAEIPQQSAKRFARNWSGKPGFFPRRICVANPPGKKNAPKFKNAVTIVPGCEFFTTLFLPLFYLVSLQYGY